MLFTKERTQRVPISVLVELLTLIPKYNLFEFNEELYQQEIGTATGTQVTPTMAIIFMVVIDTLN
jgi:hypothetical protein